MASSLQVFLEWKFWSIVVFVFGLVSLGTCQSEASSDESGSDSLDWHESVCVDFNGAYGRKHNLGVVCCKNETFMLPNGLVENWDANSQLINCVYDLRQSQNMDLVNALWNVSLCVFKNSSAFPDNKMTFDKYFTFMTSKYSTKIAQEIKKVSQKCATDGNNQKTAIEKLKKFTECFHMSEKTVCDKPYKPLSISDASDEFTRKYNCPEMHGLHGEEKTDYCCKNQSVPYNFIEFYSYFPESESEKEKAENCYLSFENKQLELDPKLKAAIDKYDRNFDEGLNDTSSESEENPREKLVQCQFACQSYPKQYDVKTLSLNYDEMTITMTRKYGSKIQQDLKKILTNRKSSIVFPFEKEKLSYEKLEKKFEEGNELTKIKCYCEFAEVISKEVERALDEYCFDAKFAEHHHHSSVLL